MKPAESATGLVALEWEAPSPAVASTALNCRASFGTCRISTKTSAACADARLRSGLRPASSRTAHPAGLHLGYHASTPRRLRCATPACSIRHWPRCRPTGCRSSAWRHHGGVAGSSSKTRIAVALIFTAASSPRVSPAAPRNPLHECRAPADALVAGSLHLRGRSRRLHAAG